MKISLVVFFLFLNFNLIGQKAPIRFGKIDMAELQMNVYDKDSTANAVVLCDYGYFNAEQFTFWRTLRIKILKTEGLDWANATYPATFETTVRGVTYNLVNGQIREDKLTNVSIFREKVTNYLTVFNLAMPNVKVGSVIDIEYRQPGIPFQWYFQQTIPVKHSELVLEPTEFVNYSWKYYGFHPFAVNDKFRWVTEDVPAFRDEPYLTSIENHISKFEFDVTDIRYKGYQMLFASSWDEIAKNLLFHNYHSGSIGSAPFLNDIAKSINESEKDGIKKIEKAFEFVKSVKFNGKNRLFTSEPNLNTVFANKSGNSTEINLILWKLLKKLNFDAYPVILSTRKNGRISEDRPTYFRLNNTVVLIKYEQEDIILDATDDLMPFDLLPLKDINGKGRIIDEKSRNWVDLIAIKKDKQLTYYDVSLTRDNSIAGKFSKSSSNYGGYYSRRQIKSFDTIDAYSTNLKKDFPGLVIDSLRIENLDMLNYPLKESYNFKLNKCIKSEAGQKFFYPMLFSKIIDNPFKLETREYPVDFYHLIDHVFVVNINLPDSVEVIDVPENIIYKTSDNSATFKYQIARDNNKLRLDCSFQINKVEFSVDEYEGLREFYYKVIAKCDEPVIISY